MPRRTPFLASGDIYHIFNRGVEKRKVFLNERDYKHFLETLEHYKGAPGSKFSRKLQLTKDKDNSLLVEVICYCLMPNHFHLLVKQLKESGISTFISKLANSYTKYFNIKNDRVGPLFQGQFKAVRVETDEQLVHLSRYVHLNPFAAELVNNLETYPWSSYPDYIGKRDTYLTVSKGQILDMFRSLNDYREFVLDQADYIKSLEELKHQLLD